MPEARVILDWSDRRHYALVARRCRRCQHPTHMRDGAGKPCHKTCAELELAAERLAATHSYFADERNRPGGVA